MKKTIFLAFVFLFSDLTHGAGRFDDIKTQYSEQKKFTATFQGHRFLKWDGDEVNNLSKSKLQTLEQTRASNVCKFFGYKDGIGSSNPNAFTSDFSESWVPASEKLALVRPSESGSEAGNAWRAVSIVGGLFIDRPVFFSEFTCFK